MTPGRSVRLFLVDGTPQGMRTAEVGNWSGLALVCPRTDLVRLGARSEVRRTGVYILVGPSETAPSGLAVYVGEGDEVWARLTSHDDSKDFWTLVVLFVSKDNNLTKAHVRHLEATLVRELKKAKRAEVKNGNVPVGGKLPEADAADMDTFFEDVRLLLPTLGLNVFTVDAPAPSTAASDELTWELKLDDGSKAECVVREGQFVVKAQSLARAREVESLGDGSRALRKTLQEGGVLVPVKGKPGFLRFTQDYAFDSPSGAAAVVSGTGLNGRINWKLPGSGVSYKEWQEKQVSGAGEA